MSITFTQSSRQFYWHPINNASQTDAEVIVKPIGVTLQHYEVIRLDKRFASNVMQCKLDERRTVHEVTVALYELGIKLFAMRIPANAQDVASSRPTHLLVQQTDYCTKFADNISITIFESTQLRELGFEKYAKIIGYYGLLNPMLVPADDMHLICRNAAVSILQRDLTKAESEGLKLPDDESSLAERYFKYMVNRENHPLFTITAESSWNRTDDDICTGDYYMAKQINPEMIESVQSLLDRLGVWSESHEIDGVHFLIIPKDDYNAYIASDIETKS